MSVNLELPIIKIPSTDAIDPPFKALPLVNSVLLSVNLLESSNIIPPLSDVFPSINLILDMLVSALMTNIRERFDPDIITFSPVMVTILLITISFSSYVPLNMIMVFPPPNSSFFKTAAFIVLNGCS